MTFEVVIVYVDGDEDHSMTTDKDAVRRLLLQCIESADGIRSVTLLLDHEEGGAAH